VTSLRPIEKETVLPAPRGRILARDGAALATIRRFRPCGQYRWLQDPADARWLRATARARLAKADRRNAQKLASAQAAVLAQRVELAERLAKLCGLSPAEWTARVRQIQARVERIAAGANLRRQSRQPIRMTSKTRGVRIRRLLLEDPPPPRSRCRGVGASRGGRRPAATVVAEIRNQADRYPGTQIVALSRRAYPGGTLAAHLLGHLGPSDTKPRPVVAPRGATTGRGFVPDDLVGRMGVERQCEAVLRGRRGLAVEQTDHGGHVVTYYRPEEPVAGRDWC